MLRLSGLVAQQLQEAHYLPPFSRKIPKGKGLNAGGLPLCFGHLCNQEYPTLVFKVDLVTMSETQPQSCQSVIGVAIKIGGKITIIRSKIGVFVVNQYQLKSRSKKVQQIIYIIYNLLISFMISGLLNSSLMEGFKKKKKWNFPMMPGWLGSEGPIFQ